MPENSVSSTAILVVGMHRSGTSAATRLLNLLGVELGGRLLNEAPDNSAGFWEHAEVVQIHERLLAGLARTWSDVRPMPLAWLEHPAAIAARSEISALVEREFANAPIWAVKDPRMCRLLPLWLGVLAQHGIRPAVLFVVRHPTEVGRSLRTRDGLSEARTRLMWVQHLFEPESASRGVKRSLITYDDLLIDPNAVIDRIRAELEIEWPMSVTSVGDDIGRHLDRARRHHHASGESPHDLAERTYSGFRQGMIDVWEHLASMSNEYAQMLLTFGAVIEELEQGGKLARSHAGDGALPHSMSAELARRVASFEAVLGWGPGGSGMPSDTLTPTDDGVRSLAEGPGTRGLNVDSCGLYFRREDQSFSEEQSIRHWVVADDGPVRVEFMIPPGADCQIVRFDPAEAPGIFCIGAIFVDGIRLQKEQFKLVSFHGHPLPRDPSVLLRFSVPFLDPYLEVDLREFFAKESHLARRIEIVFERESIKSHIVQEVRDHMQKLAQENATAAIGRDAELRLFISATLRSAESAWRDFASDQTKLAGLQTDLQAIRNTLLTMARPWWQRWRRL